MEKQQSHTILELKIRVERGLDNFLSLLKASQYRDAHEALEDVWRDERSSNLGRFLKGLINGATALQLRKIGRVDAENRVWKTFDKFMPLLKTLDVCGNKLQQVKREIEILRFS